MPWASGDGSKLKQGYKAKGTACVWNQMQVEGLEMNMVPWSPSKQALGTQGPSMRFHLPRDPQHLPVDTLGTKSLTVACEGHSYTSRHPSTLFIL